MHLEKLWASLVYSTQPLSSLVCRRGAPFSRLLYTSPILAIFSSGIPALLLSLSGLFLYLAQRGIPISTAYIIWTGIGAIGTFAIGIAFFGDSASLLRMFFALLILVGVVGLELLG